MANTSTHYDLLVFGTGIAGQGPAYAAAKAGWSVAMIDPHPPGGTCANRGCDAKKPLVYAAQAVDFAQRLAGRGISGDTGIDWGELITFKRTFTNPIPDHTRRDLKNAGITLIQGDPSFVDGDTVAVGDQRLTADKFVLANGLMPRPADFPGGEHAIDSTQFLELDQLPQRLLFIGGGFIGMEFAHVVARLGRWVTVIEKRGCPLKNFDHAMAQRLKAASEDVGIALHCDSCVDRIERREDGTLVASCSSTGQAHEADLIVNATGRIPAVDGMNLEAPGVKRSRRGIVVDKFLRSVSDPRFYAAGDVAETGMAPLTPSAGLESKILTHNLLHEDNPRELEPKPIAMVVFTVPALAQVGLTDAQAREQGLNFDVHESDMAQFKDLREQGVKHAVSKVLVEKGSDRVLGASYLGPHASELVNLVTLGMTHDLTVTQMRRPLYAYPTPGSLLPSTLK